MFLSRREFVRARERIAESGLPHEAGVAVVLGNAVVFVGCRDTPGYHIGTPVLSRGGWLTAIETSATGGAERRSSPQIASDAANAASPAGRSPARMQAPCSTTSRRASAGSSPPASVAASASPP